MNLALLEEKNLVDVWKHKETRQRKSRKKDEFSIRKSKWRINSFGFSSVLFTLATGLTKIILLTACFYVVFLSYRFVTHSPYFNVDEVTMVGNKRIPNEALNNLAIGLFLVENLGVLTSLFFILNKFEKPSLI